MDKVVLSKSRSSIMFILLVLIVISCFYFVDSSYGTDIVDDTNGNSDYDSSADPLSAVNLTITKTVHITGHYPPYKFYSSCDHYGYNESNNVILEFTNYRDSYWDIYRYRFPPNTFLKYKENNMSLSNQIIYFTVGNKTTSLVTDENGKIPLIPYFPSTSEPLTLEISFKGSKLFYNNSIIDLKPVSLYFDPFLGYLCCEVHSLDFVSNDTLVKHKSLDNNEDSKNVSNNTNNNTNTKSDNLDNSEIDFGKAKMKKTGISLIQLILFLLIILGSLTYKKS